MANHPSDVAYRRPPTAQEAVLQELRRAIMRQELRPGEAIRQDAVATRLSVSRVPVREALKVLEAEGQITYEPHRGYRVADLSLQELEELYLLRKLLEAEATHRAVTEMTDELLDTLRSYVDEMDAAVNEAADLMRFLTLNEEFHFTLFSHSGLPRLVHYIQVLWKNTDPYRSVSFNELPPRQKAQDEHRQLLQACEDRDPEAGVEVMDQHRANTIAHLRSVFGHGEATED